MFRDTPKSIASYLFDRITSPLSGTFLVSWSAINHPILIHLFSSETPQEKIEFIENNIFLWEGLALPILTTLIIIFFIPLPSIPAFKFQRWYKQKLRKINQEYEDEEPVSTEKYIELRRKSTEERIKLEGEIERKDEDITDLEKLLTECQTNNDALKRRLKSEDKGKSKTPLTDSVKPLYDRPISNYHSYDLTNEEHFDFLKKIMAQLIDRNTIDIKELNIDFMPNSTIAEYIIQKGIDNRLFKREYNNVDRKYFLELMSDGRAFIAENGITN